MDGSSGVLKVALDVGPLTPHPAGVGIYVRCLATALADQLGPSLLTLGRRSDVDDIRGSTSVAERSPKLPYPVWIQVVAPFRLRGLAVDVAHFTDGLIPPLRSQPTVVTVNDLTLVTSWRRHQAFRYPRIPLILAAPRLATRTIVPSRATADVVMRFTRTRAAKIDVVPLAPRPDIMETSADEGVLERAGLATGSYLLAVGTIEPRKNHRRVIEAFDQLVSRNRLDRDLLLVIAGRTGWSARSVITAARTGPAASRIRLLGYVSDRELGALLRHAAALVYPSLEEGFGLPVLEAMANGVPVVTSNVSSLPEVAGDAAVLIDPLSVGAIARGITEAVGASRDLRTAGLARAAQFSWALTADGTIDSYRRAVDR